MRAPLRELRRLEEGDPFRSHEVNEGLRVVVGETGRGGVRDDRRRDRSGDSGGDGRRADRVDRNDVGRGSKKVLLNDGGGADVDDTEADNVSSR